MDKRNQQTIALTLLAGLAGGLTLFLPTTAGAAEDYEVLTRGPIHEAFLEQINHDPLPGLVVDRAPPPPIDELPPEQKPADRRAIWISGYWAWEDEAGDFMWLSGVWRVPPPGCRWVPGYWTQVEQGHQWISGFWMAEEVTRVPYNAAPPRSLERGPTSAPPSPNHFWLTGHWTANQGRYQWRAGTWVPYQAGWTWTPDRYVYTPRGHVFVKGHWDQTLDARGMLFAPLRLNSQTSTSSRLVVSPTHVIPHQQLFLHLFARSSHNHYYFGDYYDQRYADQGFTTWFAVDPQRRGYDPLFDYYRWDHRRGNTDLLGRVTNWHKYLVAHPEHRPARTWARQLDFVAAHGDFAHLAQVVVAQPLADVIAQADAAAYVNLTAQQRTQWRDFGRQTTAIGSQRLQLGAATAVNAAAGGGLQLPPVTRALPGVGIPASNNIPVPDEPRTLLNVVRPLPQPVPRRVVPPVRLPRLPF